MITTIKNGYVAAIIREGADDAAYAAATEIIRRRPAAPDGYGYRLTPEFEWELYELPPEDPDLSAEAALDIILGGDTNEAL